MGPLLAAIAVLAAGTAVTAQTPAGYETYVEAYRPRVTAQPQPLASDDVAALRKALNDWKRKKTEANLAPIRIFADKGDISAQRAMMEGYLYLRNTPKDRGASAALSRPDQGLIPMSGLWAMALWRSGVRDREVAKVLDLCLQGEQSSREGAAPGMWHQISTVSSMTNDYDCGFTTEGGIFEIGRLLDYGRKNSGKRKDIPTVAFVERPVATQAQNDAARLAGILFTMGLGYDYAIPPADTAWLQAHIAANAEAKAAYDEVMFRRALAGIRSGGKPAQNSWIWAYMAADPKRRAEYDRTLALQSLDFSEERAKFTAAIAGGRPEDRDWLAVIALREKGDYSAAWWNEYRFSMSDASSSSLGQWCDVGIADACGKAYDARTMEEARRSSVAGSSGSGYTPPDLAAELKAFRDRETAINSANCARADLGASITCNR